MWERPSASSEFHFSSFFLFFVDLVRFIFVFSSNADQFQSSADTFGILSAQFSQLQPLPHAIGVAPMLTALKETDFSSAVARLWQLDSSRLIIGRDIQINAGGLIPHGANHSGKDFASAPLFSFLSPHVWSAPTVACFFALLDNYEPRCGQQETVSDIERAEEAAFLNACIQTPPMKFAHAWLLAKGLAPSGIDEFRQLLWSLWFKLCASHFHSSC